MKTVHARTIDKPEFLLLTPGVIGIEEDLKSENHFRTVYIHHLILSDNAVPEQVCEILNKPNPVFWVRAWIEEDEEDAPLCS